MEGACARCVIDNTYVVLAGGSGANAVISAEMDAFSRFFGFEFFAHNIGNPNRKAGVERYFHFIENNFLAGRRFSNWQELNEQLVDWCRLSNSKEKRRLGMSPQAVWLMERPFLQPLPEHLIPLYQAFPRVVDSRGFVNLERNQYSVPDRFIGKQVEIHKHMDHVCIYYQGREIVNHARFIYEDRRKAIKPGHHKPLGRSIRHEPCKEELLLKDIHPDLNTYISEFKKRVRGRGVVKFQRLLEMKRTYPQEAFLPAISEALHYRLYDLDRLEKMVLERVVGDFFKFDEGDLL